MQSNRARCLVGGLLVGVLAAAIFLVRLNYPLLEPDEGRYAEIPLLMVRSGNYLAPMQQGRPYLDKPPLVYWLVAGCYQAFGVHEWSARLAPALAAWLTVLAGYVWACRWLGPRPALLSAVILCTSLGFARFGRTLLPDAPLAFCLAVALWTGHTTLASSRRRWGWWLVSAACCGLGLLAKGPVAFALVLPCLALAAWQHRNRSPVSASWQFWTIYVAVATAVAAPWFLWAHWNLPGFTEEFFWRHNFVRYTAPFQHGKPWWYYGPALFAETLPWTPLLLIVPMLWLRRRRPPAPAIFCLLSAGWCLGFFTAAGCKTPAYLLPALPPLAGLLGHTLDMVLRTCRAAAAWGRASYWARSATRFLPTATAVGLLLAAAVWFARQSMLLPEIVLPALAVVMLCFALRAKAATAWSWCGLVGGVLVAFWVWQAVPAHAREATTGGPAARFARLAAAEQSALAVYRGTWDAAGFYCGGPEVPVLGEPGGPTLAEFLHQHPQTWILARAYGDRPEELRRALPADAIVQRVLHCKNVVGYRVSY